MPPYPRWRLPQWLLRLAALALAPLSEAFPDAPPLVEGIKCTQEYPDEIFLDYTNAYMTNRNLFGMAEDRGNRWLSGAGWTNDGTDASHWDGSNDRQRFDFFGNFIGTGDLLGATSTDDCPEQDNKDNAISTTDNTGCLPNPDETVRVINVLSHPDKQNPMLNVDSCLVINLRQDAIDGNRSRYGEVSRVDMVVSVPVGGFFHTNSKRGVTIEDGSFLQINVDMSGVHSGQRPDNVNTGCSDGGSACRSNFQIQFVVGECDLSNGVACQYGKAIEIPALELTWYDFDEFWSTGGNGNYGDGRECVYAYEWQQYGTTGQFIDQHTIRYVTAEDPNDGGTKFMSPYVSPGCATDELPNFKVVNGVALNTNTDATHNCYSINTDTNSGDCGRSTGITGTAVADEPYCYPPRPDHGDRAGSGSKFYWQTCDWNDDPTDYLKDNLENELDYDVGTCYEGKDTPQSVHDRSWLGYSVKGSAAGDNAAGYWGPSDYLVAYSSYYRSQGCPNPIGNVWAGHYNTQGEVMCANNDKHPLYTTQNDFDCTCQDKDPTTGRGTLKTPLRALRPSKSKGVPNHQTGVTRGLA